MASNDPGWVTLHDAIRWWMHHRGVTTQQLADHLADLNTDDVAGADQDLVTYVRNFTRPEKYVKPRLADIARIGRFLNVSDDSGSDMFDPTYFPRIMELIDVTPDQAGAVRLATQLIRLQTELTDAVQRQRISGSDGSAGVVRAALSGGEFAVAVWPGIEGPPDYPMHVADRLDIRRSNNVGTTDTDVWEAPSMKAALRAARAVRSGPGRRARWIQPTSTSGVSHWSISRIGAPTTPLVNVPHPDLPAIVVGATSVDSWVTDVGFLVAKCLGYGYTSVRDLAVEVTGLPRPPMSERNMIHNLFLAEATPTCQVWAMTNTELLPGDYYPFADVQGHTHPKLQQFFLVEQDDLLKYAAHAGKNADRPDLATLRTAHDIATGRLQRYVQEIGGQVTDLPAVFHAHPKHPGEMHRTAAWEQTLWHVHHILSALDKQHLLPNLDSIHQQLIDYEPTISRPLLGWLADHGAPGINQRWGRENSEFPRPGREQRMGSIEPES